MTRLEEFKMKNIHEISLAEAYEYSKQGLIFVIRDGHLKGLGMQKKEHMTNDKFRKN